MKHSKCISEAQKMPYYRVFNLRTLFYMALALACLPTGTSSSDAAAQKHQTRNLSLRPEFEDLLGKKVVDDFTVKAWKRSVVAFSAKPPEYPNCTKFKKPAGCKLDGIYLEGHERFNALGPVLQCPRPILSKFGEGDGEKHICGLPANGLRKSTTGGTGVIKAKDSCVIISVGSRNRWDFELGISKALPHCRIHTLDCTIDGKIPVALAKQATFHKICIGTKNTNVTLPAKNHISTSSASGEAPKVDEVLQYMRWDNFATMIGLTSPPDVMKMDIEGHEWSVLPDLAVNTPRHLLPRSISLELHYFTNMRALPEWNYRLRSPYEIGAWMDFMFTRGGYVLVDRNDNELCAVCSEIVIARVPAV